jgi:hypothetical protein
MAFQNTANILNEIQQHFGDSGGGEGEGSPLWTSAWVFACRKKAPLCKHFLSLPRACLGNMIILSIKYGAFTKGRTSEIEIARTASAWWVTLPSPLLSSISPAQCGSGSGRRENALSLLRFRYVCPEPVLVNHRSSCLVN